MIRFVKIMTYKPLSETQIRATFEDTKKNQEELRVNLDDLDKTNSFIEEGERGNFFSYLANGLLGLDFEKKCKIRLPDGKFLKIENLGRFLRHLVYYDNVKVDFDFLRKYGNTDGNKISVEIKDIWHEIKFIIYGIFPEALAMSLRISKEQTGIQKQGDSDATDYNEAMRS